MCAQRALLIKLKKDFVQQHTIIIPHLHKKVKHMIWYKKEILKMSEFFVNGIVRQFPNFFN